MRPTRRRLGAPLCGFLALVLLASACGLNGDVRVTSVPGAETATSEPEITTVTPEPDITTVTPEPEITTVTPEPEITTVTPEPEVPTKRQGSYEVTAPDTMVFGTTASVAVTAVVGGNVQVEEVDGCGLTADGVVNPPAPGRCTIRIVQEESNAYRAAPERLVTIEVTKARGVFDIEHPDSVRVGERFRVRSVVRTGGAVTLEEFAGCTVVDSGELVASATGACVLVFRQAGTDTHLPAAERRVSIAVGKQVGRYHLSGPASVTAGAEFALTATVESGGEVRWVDTDNAACSFLGDLRFRAPASTGICVITVTQNDTDTHASAGEQQHTVNVTRTVGSFTPAAPPQVEWGRTFSVTQWHVVGSSDFTYSSNCDESDGISTGIFIAPRSPGSTCEITFIQAESASHAAAPPQTVLVHVVKRQGSFTVEPIGTVEEGSYVALVISDIVGGPVSTSVDSGPCEYETAPPYATSHINEAGYVWAQQPGTCVLLFEQAEDDDYFGSMQRVSFEIVPVVIR